MFCYLTIALHLNSSFSHTFRIYRFKKTFSFLGRWQSKLIFFKICVLLSRIAKNYNRASNTTSVVKMTVNVLVISKPFFLSGISWSVPSREGFPRHKNKCIDMLDEEAIEMLVLLTEKKTTAKKQMRKTRNK